MSDLREQVAQAIYDARNVEPRPPTPWDYKAADAVMIVFAERIGELPVSHNPLGTTAWVQWLDLSDMFEVERPQGRDAHGPAVPASDTEAAR